MLYLDLGELPALLEWDWWFSARRGAPIRFKRADYLGDPSMPLDEAVRREAAGHCPRPPAGPIRMLTHPRYFGIVFNPVTFYYCLDAADTRVECIIAEITNTPWNERHRYVLHADAAASGSGESPMRFSFPKRFHISPFMEMNHDYDWQFSAPGDTLGVRMRNRQGGRHLFDARLAMRRRPLTSGGLARMTMRRPFMTARVIAGIYVQAARLWWKGMPSFAHPGKAVEKVEYVKT